MTTDPYHECELKEGGKELHDSWNYITEPSQQSMCARSIVHNLAQDQLLLYNCTCKYKFCSCLILVIKSTFSCAHAHDVHILSC